MREVCWLTKGMKKRTRVALSSALIKGVTGAFFIPAYNT